MENKQKPTKKGRLTPKQKLFIETFIKNYGHITDSCKAAKINRASYYDWMGKPVFMEAIESSIEHFNDSVQRRILKLAMNDDKDMLKFWAKNQMKHRGWVEKTEIEHTGEQETVFNLIVKSTEEIKREKLDNQPKAT